MCISSDQAATELAEPGSPPPPFLRFYVVRAQNGCSGSGVNNIGTRSDGTPRTGRTCP